MPPAGEPSPDVAAAVNVDNADDGSDFSTTDDDNTTHEFFSHTPLDLHKASIRIIKVHKVLSADEGLIQCSIEQATTSASYCCLSYRWGNPSRHHYFIRINGKRFAVRRNLFNYLRVLRTSIPLMSTQSEPMWIDALCIDQDNPQERNHQVAQMGEIYSEARCVYVWLGNIPHPATLERLSVTSQDRMKDVSLLRKGRVNANIITQNEYWNRTWIIQEVILARHVEFVLHDRTIYLADFLFDIKGREDGAYKQFYELFRYRDKLKSQSLLRIGHNVRLLQSSGSPLPNKSQADNLFRQIHYDHRLTILLGRFRNRKCENPYDRIFSLLSIAEEGPDVQVVYSKPATEVAFQVLSCCERTLCVCSASLVATRLELGDAKSIRRDGNIPFLELKLPLKLWRYYLSICGYETKNKLSSIDKLNSCPALYLVALHVREELISSKYCSHSAHTWPLQYEMHNHAKKASNNDKDVERRSKALFEHPLNALVDQDNCLEVDGLSCSSTNSGGYFTIRLSLELLGACFAKKQYNKALELCDFVTWEQSWRQEGLLLPRRLKYANCKLGSEAKGTAPTKPG
jgi:hypothetical protein